MRAFFISKKRGEDLIKLVNVSKEFRQKNNSILALDNVNINVSKGEIHGVIGYSGAGKSTLIRCINLLEKPDKGQVLYKDEDITRLKESDLRQRRKKIGMIFQHFNLMPSRNVYENIAYPLKKERLSKEDEGRIIAELLEIVELDDKELAYPSQLSGGQKQRVAIARALANRPEVLLCDEATSALDPKTTKSILRLLKKLRDELDLTIILITHEMEVIKEICHKVSIMERGKIVEQSDVVSIFSNPRSEVTKEFIQTTSNKNKLDEILSGSNNTFGLRNDDILVRVQYVGDLANEGILSQASRLFNIEISVLFGNFDVIGNTPIGELIVFFRGEEEGVKKGLNYFIQKGLKIEIIKRNGEI